MVIKDPWREEQLAPCDIKLVTKCKEEMVVNKKRNSIKLKD